MQWIGNERQWSGTEGQWSGNEGQWSGTEGQWSGTEGAVEWHRQSAIKAHQFQAGARRRNNVAEDRVAVDHSFGRQPRLFVPPQPAPRPELKSQVTPARAKHLGWYLEFDVPGERTLR